MTLEEDEDIGLNPALSASGHQVRSEKRPPATKVHLTLTRFAEIAAAIPIIILLLPVYALIQLGAAAVCIHRILRKKLHRRVLIAVVRRVRTNVHFAPKEGIRASEEFGVDFIDPLRRQLWTKEHST